MAAPAKPRRRRRGKVVLAVVLAVPVAICTTTAVAARFDRSHTGGSGTSCTLKIGYLGGLTGDGEVEVKAVRLAVAEYNDRHSTCVRLVEYGTDDSDAAAQAGIVAGDPGVLGIVGPVYASDADAALPVLDPVGVPVISPSASDTYLTAKGWRTFFRTLPSDTEQTDAGIRYLRSVLRAGHTFVVLDDSSFGSAVAPEARRLLGTSLAGHATVTTKQYDFHDVVAQIVHSGADSVFLAGLGADGGRFVEALRAAGSRIPVLGGDRLMSTTYFDAVRADPVTGIYATCPCVPDVVDPDGFGARYRTRYGKYPDFYAAEAYDAATVLLSGIAAGRTARSTLLAWVAGYDRDGVGRHIRFDAHGNLATAQPNVWAYQLKDDGPYHDQVIPPA
jgi:branched-chain amino acid transport system substrate-binding protein